LNRKPTLFCTLAYSYLCAPKSKIASAQIKEKRKQKTSPTAQKRQINFGDKNSTKNVGYSCQQALKLIAGLVLFESFVHLVKYINKLKGHC